jgi:hypothetical protein
MKFSMTGWGEIKLAIQAADGADTVVFQRSSGRSWALSPEKSQGRMSIGDLARHLMVSQQNLSGLTSRILKHS